MENIVIDSKVHDKNASNGLITTIWGPHLWEALHSITFGYPINPTDEDKKNYKNYFVTLQYVLPCVYCRKSYSMFITTDPTKLTDDVFASRQTLTHWMYLLHERVNEKLGVTYGITFDDVCKKYESYRAVCDPLQHGCIMPLDIKAKSFENANKKFSPIIPFKLAKCFAEYAKKRNISFDKLDYYNTISKNINTLEWDKRNKECITIVNHMRLNGIAAIETSGEYKDLPSTNELLLIGKLSSTKCLNDLYTIANKLGAKISRTYKINIID